MLSGMDVSIKPCNNFYKFMCGNWGKGDTNQIGQNYTETLDSLNNIIHDRIIDLFKNMTNSVMSKSFEKARQLHKSCMDIQTINEYGVKSLFDYLKPIGGWPLTHSRPIFPFCSSWQKAFKKRFQNRRSNPFFFIFIGKHITESNTRMITIDQPTIVSPSNLKGYRKLIYDIVLYLAEKRNKSISNSKLRQDIKEMVEFERKLAEIAVPESEKTPVYQIINSTMTIEEFQKFYNSHGGNHKSAKIDWLETIQLLFKQVGIEIQKSEQLFTSSLDFFKRLPGTLRDATPRTIVNYMAWTTIRYMVQYVNTRFITRGNALWYTKNDKLPSEEERYSTCLLHPNLYKAISFEYVKKYFPENVKEKSQEIINHMVKSAKEAINSTGWMDETTKQKFIEKLESMVTLVGYPDSYNSSTIDEYYNNFQLGSNYLESILNLQALNDLKELNSLRKPFDKREWFNEPTEVDAFYTRTSNSMTLTAGILQFPVISVDTLDVLNLAMLGSIVAHELSHGFDDIGQKLDKDGNLADWWTPQMYDLYFERSKCFIEQFSNYTIPELSTEEHTTCVNGEKTQSENIADTTGLHISSNALQNLLRYIGDKDNRSDIRLEELKEYNMYKLFFMRYANFFCDVVTPERLAYLYTYDCHSIPEFRVNRAISNNKYFAEVFECEPDAPMNPSKKCSILT
ncbi:endothelin-converting enzyme 1-like isoform X2 [Prorops nasuta]